MVTETKKKPDGGCMVILYQYLAYNGGLSSKRSLMWMYGVIGHNGQERSLSDSCWNGHPDKKHAEQTAKDLSDFLGWPIHDLGRCKWRDEKIRAGHDD